MPEATENEMQGKKKHTKEKQKLKHFILVKAFEMECGKFSACMRPCHSTEVSVCAFEKLHTTTAATTKTSTAFKFHQNPGKIHKSELVVLTLPKSVSPLCLTSNLGASAKLESPNGL